MKSRRPGKIGIFGGTFDPPHLGHLLLAECAREALALDRVVVVPAHVGCWPAGQPPVGAGGSVGSVTTQFAPTGTACTMSWPRCTRLMFWSPPPQFATIEKWIPEIDARVLFCTLFVTSR